MSYENNYQNRKEAGFYHFCLKLIVALCNNKILKAYKKIRFLIFFFHFVKKTGLDQNFKNVERKIISLFNMFALP